MKLNLDQKLYDLNGKPLGNNGNELVIKDYVANVLMNPEGAKEKMKEFWLALKVKQSNGEVDLTPEEITLAKNKVKALEGPLLTGQVCQILDGRENPMAPKKQK